MTRKTLLLILAISLPALPRTGRAETPTEAQEYENKGKGRPGPPVVVAKGPCRKIDGKFENGMKLYLTTDRRLIGEVTAYRPSHLFPDGKSREAVRLKLTDGKSTWLPADTARRIYVTQ